MENNLENLTIGVFAKAAGVNVETIRFYQRKGLLREPDKPYGSIRRYGEADVVRVKFVKSAQRLGFSLDEIAELLRLDDGTHCEEASSLAEHKLKDVREKMADLARMETVLSELVCACHARKGNVSCPLIASLQGEAGLARSARGLTLSGTKTHVKQRFLPLTPLLMVSDVLWSPVLPA
ncbi:mercuric resistance operon regulatory protein [Escherichia coli HVH 109 (4-6977162)]|nr:mercuric resistance operon regulatory protein [Escherichia coli HVH 109 (4-6977162)]